MAINVSQAFHRTSANPIDESLALTKAQMLTVNDNLMPSKYFTVCQDDGKIYLYDKTNEPDVATGKFREFEGGGEITIDSTPTEGSTNAVQSGGTYTALANKVDKVSGKGLSTNDYTTAEKDKLAGINLSNYIPTSQKGVSNGVATLGANGKVPMSQIPNGLDETIFGYRNPVDELFYEDAEFTEPITPEAGIFYYDELSTNFYRWTGTAYVSFTDGSTGLVLGEVTGTAYDGGKGKENRDAITAIKDGQSIDSFGDVETALSNKVDKVSGKGLSTNDYDNTEKTKVTNAQPKTLATAKTIEGASVTTVQGVADAVQTHTDRLVTDANGVHGFKVTTSGGQDKIYYKSGNSWEEIELGSSIQVSELPTASQDNVGSLLQYIGNTTSVAPIYKHGYFYECVEDGGNYSWQNVPLMDVQEIQKVVLPTASVDELGNIYQYVGSTTQTYKKGFFYECTRNGAAYEWISVRVQAGGGQTIQYDIMPTASGENEDDIIQYVGETTANYTNGYFYKCVAQGTDPETYEWEAQSVQEGGSGQTIQYDVLPPARASNKGSIYQYIGSEADYSFVSATPLFYYTHNGAYPNRETVSGSTKPMATTYTASSDEMVVAICIDYAQFPDRIYGREAQITTTGDVISEAFIEDVGNKTTGHGSVCIKNIVLKSGDTISFTGRICEDVGTTWYDGPYSRQVYLVYNAEEIGVCDLEEAYFNSNFIVSGTSTVTNTYTASGNEHLITISLGTASGEGIGEMSSLGTMYNIQKNDVDISNQASYEPDDNVVKLRIANVEVQSGDVIKYKGSSTTQYGVGGGVLNFAFKYKTYTHGYFYESTQDGQDYYWQERPTNEIPQSFTQAEMEEIKSSISTSTANVNIETMEIYSPIEHKVGWWQEEVDGVLKQKPVYEKVIVLNQEQIPNSSLVTINHTIPLDKPISVIGMLYSNSSNGGTPLPRVQDNEISQLVAIDFNETNFYIKGRGADFTYTFDGGHIIARYTKTTDEWEVVE